MIMYTQYSKPCFLKIRLLLVFLFATCSFLGCGGSSLTKLTGTVTVDGSPAVGALVIYHPQGEGKMATGVADAEGKYQLVTDAEMGVSPGKYQITLTWPDPNQKQEAGSLLSPASSEPGPDLLKGKFIKKESSGLSAEITAGLKELPPIAVTTK